MRIARVVGFLTVFFAMAAVLAVVGFAVSTQLKIGDLDPGAPELRADSRYNRDVAFLTSHYGASSDVFAVMVKTPEGSCSQYEVLRRVDQLEWELMDLPGVESTQSMARLQRRVTALTNGRLGPRAAAGQQAPPAANEATRPAVARQHAGSGLRTVGGDVVSASGSVTGCCGARPAHRLWVPPGGRGRGSEVDPVPGSDVHQIGDTGTMKVGFIGETGPLGQRELVSHGVDLRVSLLFGQSPTDRKVAHQLGMTFVAG